MEKMNDKIKEEIAHLRQCLLISVLVIFGTTGWIFVNYEIITTKIVLAFICDCFFAIISIIFHVKIIKNLKNIKNGNNNS